MKIIDYTRLGFIKDTPFDRNYWLYNSYHVIKYAVLFIYFIRQLKNRRIKKIFTFLATVAVISFVVNFMFSDVFFTSSAAYDAIVGTILLAIIIFTYYLELLSTDRILYFKRDITFYISLGMLVWHLVVTPLLIYSKYITKLSPEFLVLNSRLLLLTNLFLYGLMIAGFVVCAPKRWSLAEKEEE